MRSLKSPGERKAMAPVTEPGAAPIARAHAGDDIDGLSNADRKQRDGQQRRYER